MDDWLSQQLAEMELPIPRKLPWDDQPGWREPMRVDGIEVDPTLRFENSGDKVIGLKIRICDAVDFVGVCFSLGEGTQAQVYTEDEPPKIYDLQAPETDLILSTRPRHYRSSTQIFCAWKIRLLAGNDIRFEVAAWHWDEEERRREKPRPPVPPLVQKIHDDASALWRLEQRADKIARRRESTIFSKLTDEEFENHLNFHHPLPKRTPEEIQALLENAPLIRQRMQALKTRAGRISLGLES
ncbi:hypothetical protein CfE428DRAFT_5710 [Chthoniobacter flavus Ellin428]|uniref:Uncharacterized protein n=1 Tax=Chthoniobacter flavus Ellin428 TaxID=497964 RepID=B4D9Z3_9BACT|nr:hypothetical protein [Chthoniobacter flavus]EDY16747.1 hypothetical protein CfE428DRAFT_5710 [Chthoniobacter flavus Ellin428]TCO81829.1 hypothetical protein EV701_1534 [Chthoniobacter flavus]